MHIIVNEGVLVFCIVCFSMPLIDKIIIQRKKIVIIVVVVVATMLMNSQPIYTVVRTLCLQIVLYIFVAILLCNKCVKWIGTMSELCGRSCIYIFVYSSDFFSSSAMSPFARWINKRTTNLRSFFSLFSIDCGGIFC